MCVTYQLKEVEREGGKLHVGSATKGFVPPRSFNIAKSAILAMLSRPSESHLHRSINFLFIIQNMIQSNRKHLPMRYAQLAFLPPILIGWRVR